MANGKMTKEEAIKMLEAKLECMIRDVSGIDDDCNRGLCRECHLNYDQGNIGEQKEYLRMSIEALKQEQNTWNLDDAREDFMYDVFNTLDFLPTNDEANRIIDSFDKVTRGIKYDVLDKIRAEIGQLASRYTISRERGGMGQVEWSDRLIKESEVMQILDKYKAESEERNGRR